MDRILLHGVELEVHVGVPEEERRQTQTVFLDLALECDLKPAGGSDQVEDTVDYAAVHALVKRVAAGHPHALIEAMAERVAAAVLAKFPVDAVTVRVRKPEALRERLVEWAGVEIRRARHEGE